jgi:hypothetical protein
MPKIVLAGQDVRLLETRAAVLRKTGASVVYCEGFEALNLVASETPDLLVLCHSLEPEESEAIADGIHTCCPKTKVLLVVSQVIAERPHRQSKFDATSLPEPARLIARVVELLPGLPHTRVIKALQDSQGLDL